MKTILIATLILWTVTLNAQIPQEPVVLSDHMKAMKTLSKAIAQSLPDHTLLEAADKVPELRSHILAASQFVPHSISADTTLNDLEKRKKTFEFQRIIFKLLPLTLNLETALLNQDTSQSEKVLQDIHSVQVEGHELFKED